MHPMSGQREVVTRFAPSPSGHLHVGGARTALFCWAYARGRGGRFILRIEDTDRKRSSDAAALEFLQDLKWLGIEWDEGPTFDGLGGGPNGPYFQSERLDIYHRVIDQLLQSGAAYRAFETPEELEVARAEARAQNRTFRYERAAGDLDEATIERYLREGRPYVVRLRVPQDITISFRDEVLGEVQTPAGELDDFIILKADGYPVYHFAVVVDDELMGVTHVIRGQEHVNNTARHVLLQDALGFRRPVYAHVSTITNPNRSKMSKRDKDKALRAAVRERRLEEPPTRPGSTEPAVAREHWSWWLSDSDHQLEHDAAIELAEALQIDLPEINVDDFRRSGYLPEVLVNYLALLGWSPGENLEKFAAHVLIERFDLDRLIKSSATFDREKLLAFNLDFMQTMSTEEFRERFRRHCGEFHPEFLERLSPENFDRLADANHDRSKTLEDPIRSSLFFIIEDDAVVYEDSKPVRKALCPAIRMASITSGLCSRSSQNSSPGLMIRWNQRSPPTPASERMTSWARSRSRCASR